MTLLEVIAWLQSVEELAAFVYAEAAESVAVNANLADFLKRLADDEATHFHLMVRAAELMRSQGGAMLSAILVDSETKERLERPLRDLHAQFERDELTEPHVLEAVVASESSEWNDIFLYVINYCAEISLSFQYLAATVQAHVKRIERFLSATDEYAELAVKLSSLPTIWKSRLLVVEDDAAMRSLLVRALGRYGHVTAAENGEEALDQIRKSFFNVVVTDVDMPLRDGLSLLCLAISEDDLWRSHFIVCTGNPTDEVRKVTDENGVPLLEKPISIQQLWKAVEEVLQAVPSAHSKAEHLHQPDAD